jgi:hypothetical protein
MSQYKLVNPIIGGSFETTYKGKTQLEAGRNAWDSMSTYLTGSVPKFLFTLQNTNDGQLHHFTVNETVTHGKNIEYSLNELQLNMTTDQQKNFKNQLTKVDKKVSGLQNGGKHRKDDDSSSSSSSDDEEFYEKLRYMKNKYSQPITYWWYNPIVYGVDNLYIPTFTVPLTPYVHVNLTSAFLN